MAIIFGYSSFQRELEYKFRHQIIIENSTKMLKQTISTIQIGAYNKEEYGKRMVAHNSVNKYLIRYDSDGTKKKVLRSAKRVIKNKALPREHHGQRLENGIHNRY